MSRPATPIPPSARHPLARGLSHWFGPVVGAKVGQFTAEDFQRSVIEASVAWVAAFSGHRLLYGVPSTGGLDRGVLIASAAWLLILALEGLRRYGQGTNGPEKEPRGTVLVVEDDQDLLAVLVRSLTLRWWDVRWATTADGAIGQLSPAPDWIVLDLMLPGGTGGYDVLRHVRAGRLPTKVVVTTAVGEGGPAVAAAQGYGPEAVLYKPFAMEDLVGVLEGRETANKRGPGR